MPSSVTALGQARSSGPGMAPSACCCSPAAVQRRLPILAWLPSYSLQWLKMDFVAGLSVGLTAIPQALAYAEVAGLPP
ncbi:SLC26A11 isoform 10, partial [Pan troglodytes]